MRAQRAASADTGLKSLPASEERLFNVAVADTGHKKRQPLSKLPVKPIKSVTLLLKHSL